MIFWKTLTRRLAKPIDNSFRLTSYRPPKIFCNGHINTIAASSNLRKLYAKRASNTLRKECKSITLELKNNVRLQGLLNIQKDANEKHKPLVMIIHGWLGCADSLYLLPLASSLYQKGFNVFRLNLRDHGGTENLNRELFHSCRLDEVLHATKTIQDKIPHSDFILIGFSLGGNFVLRIGANANEHDLNIKNIISICPVMDPENALNETKSMFALYTEYYLRRWKKLLHKKHRYFPNEYNLKTIGQQKTLTSMTEHLLLQYTEFNCLQSYLKGYSVTGDRLKSLSVQSDVFIAEDDPIIPATDREKLYRSKYLNLQVTKFGGHCGYLTGLFDPNWVDQQIIKLVT